MLKAKQGNWLYAFYLLLALSFSSLPSDAHVRIPPEFELLTVVFIYASLYLGEVHDFYTKYWWWDILLHTGSGLIIGIWGFLLVICS